ncbi:MAG: alpha-galactosidase [Solobacterium sp.]|nr:alpha-galactosidase [Solobacterium sp.]
MPVVYKKQDGTITIHTRNTSYQMKIGPLGLLLHTYYGPTINTDAGCSLVYRDRGFSPNPYDAGIDRTISADTLPLEYSCEAAGDYRAPALSINRKDGFMTGDMRYEGHQVVSGKYSLPGMPAVYADEAEAETLIVTLKEKNTGLKAVLKYGVLPELDVITRTAEIINGTSETVIISQAASAAVDIMTSADWDLIHFSGRHAGERTPYRTEIAQRETVISSRRGISSHHQNPFVILAEKETNEQYGQCIGMNLLWSGSFAANVSKDSYGSVHAVMGIQPDRFDYPLEPGESFIAPEIALTFSNEGLGRLSRNYHKLIAEHVCRGPWKNRRRPVLINNWEATEMNFTGEKIISIAKKAGELGVEMLVLDDGWFGKRDDDFAGLGDWYVNTNKLGCTMGELAEEVRKMGMKFGFWIEPEMVNEDSDLYREHPDWAFAAPDIDPIRDRYQLVLDFSREEVVDHVLDQICEVIDDCKADYIKMDMNRPLFDIYSRTAEYQSRGRLMYKYVLGVYRFMEKLLERYPDLLLEGCSGGGGRFDAGMLYYCPQIWCSDNTDAIDRVRIQYGTSFAYPIRTMGAHVSACPNYDTKRYVPIDTRAVVAMEGTFGYELDLNRLSEKEMKQVTAQIETFKKYWNILHCGLYYRLTDVMENRQEAAWMMVSEDGSEALLNIVTLDVTGNKPNRFIRCAGLDPDASYRDDETGMVYSGNLLMSTGLLMPMRAVEGHNLVTTPPEYDAFQIHFTKI